MKFKAHPLMILDSIMPFLWILVIPFIKAVLQYIQDGKINNILGFETVLLSVIIALAILRFLFFRVLFIDDKIIIKKGIFFITRSEISRKNISSVQTEQNPLDLILGAVTYRINTEAGIRSRSDFKFKLTRRDSEKLSSLLYNDEKMQKIPFSALKIALMAITTSSAVTGLLIGVPIINNAGRLLGIGIYELLEELNKTSNRVQTYFPPVVNTITLILIIGYGISFLYSFIKYINFRLYLNEKFLKVCSGFFVRRITFFKKKDVNSVKIEQTPLMFLFKRFALKVSVGGFSVSKNAQQIIVPSGRGKDIKAKFAEYFPFLKPDGADVSAKRSRLIRNRFLFWPLIYLILTLSVSITAVILFEEFTRFIFFLTIILLCVVFYYAFICDYEYRKGKVCFCDSIYAHSVKGFRTCRFYFPKEKVGEIKITQFGFDRFYNSCRVKISVCSETADTLTVRHLDIDEVLNQINNCFNTEV